MSVENWEHFFKPEVRSSGRSLFSQGKVSISQPSDTEVVVFIRATTSFKVSLKTKSISGETLFVDCNCPAGKKDLFCKHIWAGLLATEAKNPDFFESIKDIEKKESFYETVEKPKPTAQNKLWEEKQAAFKEKQTAFKEKQNAYRKEQYQKQKQKIKDLKKNKKSAPEEIQFPLEVEKALMFFSQNGFELRDILNKEVVSASKKKLARIFHPDLGGSHDEILELNKFTDVLMGYLNK